MSSKDFYLDPKTLSNMYLQAVEKAGYKRIVGWRSVRPDVEALTEDGKILALTTDGSYQVVVTEVEQPAPAS
jgi:hypothetical protein